MRCSPPENIMSPERNVEELLCPSPTNWNEDSRYKSYFWIMDCHSNTQQPLEVQIDRMGKVVV